MKTAMIYNEYSEGIAYYVLDGDFSHLNGVIINSCESEDSDIDKLLALMFDADGKSFQQETTLDEFAQAIRDGAIAIEAGMYP